MDRLLLVIFMNNAGVATMTVNTNHVSHRGRNVVGWFGVFMVGLCGLGFQAAYGVKAA